MPTELVEPAVPSGHRVLQRADLAVATGDYMLQGVQLPISIGQRRADLVELLILLLHHAVEVRHVLVAVAHRAVQGIDLRFTVRDDFAQGGNFFFEPPVSLACTHARNNCAGESHACLIEGRPDRVESRPVRLAHLPVGPAVDDLESRGNPYRHLPTLQNGRILDNLVPLRRLQSLFDLDTRRGRLPRPRQLQVPSHRVRHVAPVA